MVYRVIQCEKVQKEDLYLSDLGQLCLQHTNEWLKFAIVCQNKEQQSCQYIV